MGDIMELEKYMFTKEDEVVNNGICFIKEPVIDIVKQIGKAKSDKIILSGPKGSGKSIILKYLSKYANVVHLKIDDNYYNATIKTNELDALVEIDMALSLLRYAKKFNKILFEEYFGDDLDYLKDVYHEVTSQIKLKNDVGIHKKITIGQYTKLLFEKINNMFEVEKMLLIIDNLDVTDEYVQNVYEEYFSMFDCTVISSSDPEVYENYAIKRSLYAKGYDFVWADYGNKASVIKNIINARISCYNLRSTEANIPKLNEIVDYQTFKYITNKAEGNIDVVLSAIYRTYTYFSRKNESVIDKNVAKEAVIKYLYDVLMLEERENNLIRKRNLYL